MDFPGHKQEMHAVDDDESPVTEAPKDESRVPFTFFDPASMHELQRTMTARSTRSYHRPRDTSPAPPLPKPRDNGKPTISIAMESNSGSDDDFNFEQTLKDLVRRYVIRNYLITGSNLSQTG